MKWTDKIKKEKGAVPIVEAAFVFPVVFFVVIAMILFGNVLYQQAKMDAVAVRGAEYLASHYANPVLQNTEIPTVSTSINVKPYRFLVGDSATVDTAKTKIRSWASDVGDGFFSGMKPNGIVVNCELKNYVVYQTANVSITYNIEFLPFNFFNLKPMVKTSNATVTAAIDPTEFIRNVDMVLDYSEQTGLSDKIRALVGKFK